MSRGIMVIAGTPVAPPREPEGSNYRSKAIFFVSVNAPAVSR
jgi:hypothetical protein